MADNPLRVDRRIQTIQTERTQDFIILTEEQVKGIVEEYIKANGYTPVKVKLCTDWYRTADDGWGTPTYTRSVFKHAEIEVEGVLGHDASGVG